MTITEARNLFAYEWWATNLLLDVVQSVPGEEYRRALCEQPNPTLRDHFVHYLHTIDGYRANIAGDERLPLHDDDCREPRDLLPLRNLVQARMDALLKKLADQELSETRRIHRRDAAYDVPVEDILRHVVNHGTYHRGQIAFALKILGVEFPDTDYFIWIRNRLIRPAPSPIAAQTPSGDNS